MKITTQLDQNPAKTFQIFLDDDPWRRGHLSILRPAELPSQCTTLEEIEELLLQLELKGAKRYVLRRLAKQNLPSQALATLLSKKEVSSQAIEQVLADCMQGGYIDNNAWIEAYIRTQLARKMGPNVIAQKLRLKGIPSPIITAALQIHASQDQQVEALQRLLATRYRSRDLTQPKEKQKVIAALVRKGFPLSLIFTQLA